MRALAENCEISFTPLEVEIERELSTSPIMNPKDGIVPTTSPQLEVSTSSCASDTFQDEYMCVREDPMMKNVLPLQKLTVDTAEQCIDENRTPEVSFADTHCGSQSLPLKKGSIDDNKPILDSQQAADLSYERQRSKGFLHTKSYSYSPEQGGGFKDNKRRSSLVIKVKDMWNSVFSSEESSYKVRKGTGALKYPVIQNGCEDFERPDDSNDYYCPVYVMLPLDTIDNDGSIADPAKLSFLLRKLKYGGVDGVMFDCWWGLVETEPMKYDFSGYTQLIHMVAEVGLLAQVVMSFHKCGGNVGDSVDIPLPDWVINTGKSISGLFYEDRYGNVDFECLSLGADDAAAFPGGKEGNLRTGIDLCRDFMRAFTEQFDNFLSAGIIKKISVGLGPCGELRYPSYQMDKWSYPGIGEFQCYDKNMQERLKVHAFDCGVPLNWGEGGPENCGHYNSKPSETEFFSTYDNEEEIFMNDEDETYSETLPASHESVRYAPKGPWDSEYGKFFLNWYSSELVLHGERIIKAGKEAFSKYAEIEMGAKVAGVHWWYNTDCHAAELTAGFYNTEYRNGYIAIAQMFKRHDVDFIFTCIEMKNSKKDFHQAPFSAPASMVKQVFSTAMTTGCKFDGENALPRYDFGGYHQVLQMAKQYENFRLSGFTYLRLCDKLLLHDDYFDMFTNYFVRNMHKLEADCFKSSARKWKVKEKHTDHSNCADACFCWYSKGHATTVAVFNALPVGGQPKCVLP
eukprot:Nk52_evm59s745 gene=Nk52_evmTU59s745